MTTPAVNRTFKDSLFRMIFREKKELLDLYNAINESHYENPDDIEINTLEDAIYVGIKNDISFILDDTLSLFEAQSTLNPNMPLRGIFYINAIMKGYVAEYELDIYSAKQLHLPTPQYVVFYNGTKEEGDRKIQRLSDSFTKKGPKKDDLRDLQRRMMKKTLELENTPEGTVRWKHAQGDSSYESLGCLCGIPSGCAWCRNPQIDEEFWRDIIAVECTAVLININYGHNQELMERCQKLYEYTYLVEEIRKRQKECDSLREAAEKAMDHCINRGILAEFLKKHRMEVTDVILTEYNEELHIKSEKQISFEEGEKVGEARGERIGFVKTCQKFKKTKEETAVELMEEFSMTDEEARECLEKYWKT